MPNRKNIEKPSAVLETHLFFLNVRNIYKHVPESPYSYIFRRLKYSKQSFCEGKCHSYPI